MAKSQKLILLLIATFLLEASGLPQTTASNTGPSATSDSPLPPPMMGINCMTGGGDARMDSFTVKRLSTLFCNKLLAHPPRLTGENFSSAEYPTDLETLPNNLNYTLLEEEGYVAAFDLTIGSSYIDNNGTIHKQGQQSQCASDNCLRIYDAIINRCEWNTHYFGGFNQHISACGFYSVYTLNCTNNLVNRDCSRWHSKWQPSYTVTSTSSSYTPVHYTNTDFCPFTLTLTGASTTVTSQVMVSTTTGPDWTSITPMMFTVDATYTGFVPNPSFDGPTFSPRFSSINSTSSPAPYSEPTVS